jgi:4-diphosphocytidyl-2-C-methyl-D-erythritol kinase
MTLGEGVRGDVPPHDENLAFVAAKTLVDRVGATTGLDIDIAKKIPMGAGLGGGSGNAAGVLVAANELLNAGMDRSALNEVALAVGSDVPFCLLGGTALVTGRGEKLTAMPSPESMCFVVGLSADPLLTREVYSKWDELEPVDAIGSATMTMALSSGDPGEIAQLLHNDLEPAAFALRPGLHAKKEAMAAAGALGAGMTGSGPTIFGIASSKEHAKEIAAKVTGSFDRVVIADSAAACVERLD